MTATSMRQEDFSFLHFSLSLGLTRRVFNFRLAFSVLFIIIPEGNAGGAARSITRHRHHHTVYVPNFEIFFVRSIFQYDCYEARGN